MANTSELTMFDWRDDPTDCDADAITAALAPITADYDLAFGARRVHTATYLDTVDGRLGSRGLVLTHEHGTADNLALLSREQVLTAVLPEQPQWPARIEQLHESPLRDALADAMWIRAVGPIAHGRTVSRVVAVLNSDAKTVVRIHWTEVHIDGHDDTAVARLEIKPLLGYQHDANNVADALHAAESFDVADRDFVDTLIAVTAQPTAQPPPPMTADTPAAAAVATALHGFADAIAANVAGVVDDVDTEFLHDLRVAVRRTRSMLKLAGDVLPDGLKERVEPDFRLLGDLTTPTRDLDVYLLDLPTLGDHLLVGEPTDLVPFGEHLRRQRELELRKLVRVLRSKRFTDFLATWRESLTAVTAVTVTVTAEATESSTPTAGALASQRIMKTYKKVVRLAKAITPDSHHDEVHSLRKRCKELRYLLEVFGPVCEPEAHKATVKDLKKLQDLLGDFQDGEMQSAGLRVFATQMLESREPTVAAPPAATLLAMGELSAHFARQQASARAALTDQLDRFLGSKARHRIEAMLP
ncbi:CHAD domain-containing protein [Antrihabitans sp. NCIMB 15449]|uniref:CHAD domain-containing protein n=1 Tax=Antrihabitans spumae TaxID=3373370 RepID=A0ABW7JK32_9NOCA